MNDIDPGFLSVLMQHGISRRTFLKFTAGMAATLALPATFGPRIAKAIAASGRVPVIWLEGQDCAGNTEAFLRASHPTAAELVLDVLSLDYHETIMAPSGAAAEASKASTLQNYPNEYVLVVEGSIPLADDGIYCTVGGRTFKSIVQDAGANALAVIAVGTCAFDGGLPGASGGPTAAVGVKDLLPGKTVINLPGCPLNVENLTATIVHYLTFKEWPALDSAGRPLFAYGQLIHDQCERRAHFEQGEYVLAWGDEGHRKGWCLYKMGCKGPETFANCPTARFNERTSWPVKVGHGCVGCTMPAFWDQMTPFYRRLPTPPPFGTEVTADQIGIGLVGAVAGLTAVHAGVSYARGRRQASAAAAAEAASSEGAASAASSTLEPPPPEPAPSEPAPSETESSEETER